MCACMQMQADTLLDLSALARPRAFTLTLHVTYIPVPEDPEHLPRVKLLQVAGQIVSARDIFEAELPTAPLTGLEKMALSHVRGQHVVLRLPTQQMSSLPWTRQLTLIFSSPPFNDMPLVMSPAMLHWSALSNRPRSVLVRFQPDCRRALQVYGCRDWKRQKPSFEWQLRVEGVTHVVGLPLPTTSSQPAMRSPGGLPMFQLLSGALERKLAALPLRRNANLEE